MKILFDRLPYVLLALTVVALLFSVVTTHVPFSWLVQEDLLSQAAHWLSGGSTAVTVGEAPGENTPPQSQPEHPGSQNPDPESIISVVVFDIEAEWWAQDAARRERDAGQFLATLVEAEGQRNVVSWGVLGLGLHDPGFALVLEHGDPLVIRAVVSELTVLPATQWFIPRVVFYGKADPKKTPPADETLTPPARDTMAVLLLEQRNADWFLLAPQKKTQLLGPRLQALQAVGVEKTRCFTELGFSPYSDLTIIEGISVADLADLRGALRENWEQTYIDSALAYFGPRLSTTRLFDSVR